MKTTSCSLVSTTQEEQVLSWKFLFTEKLIKNFLGSDVKRLVQNLNRSRDTRGGPNHGNGVGCDGDSGVTHPVDEPLVELLHGTLQLAALALPLLVVAHRLCRGSLPGGCAADVVYIVDPAHRVCTPLPPTTQGPNAIHFQSSLPSLGWQDLLNKMLIPHQKGLFVAES